MAAPGEVWVDEGLDMVLGIFPKNGTFPANTFLALFTAFSATSVYAVTASSNAGVVASYTEPVGSGYTRMTVSSASWGSQTAGTAGRKVTAGQVTFPTATTGGWGTLNGFTLCSALTSNSLYFAANFDDTTAVAIASNDVIKLTATIQYNQ